MQHFLHVRQRLEHFTECYKAAVIMPIYVSKTQVTENFPRCGFLNVLTSMFLSFTYVFRIKLSSPTSSASLLLLLQGWNPGPCDIPHSHAHPSLGIIGRSSTTEPHQPQPLTGNFTFQTFFLRYILLCLCACVCPYGYL